MKRTVGITHCALRIFSVRLHPLTFTHAMNDALADYLTPFRPLAWLPGALALRAASSIGLRNWPV